MVDVPDGQCGTDAGSGKRVSSLLSEYLPAAIARYQNEVRRLYGVLDRRLADNEWLATDFSIADIANWCWCRIHNWAGVAIDDLPNLGRWMAAIAQRPGCAKGVQLPHETNYNDLDASQADAFVKDVQERQYGQDDSFDDPSAGSAACDRFLRPSS